MAVLHKYLGTSIIWYIKAQEISLDGTVRKLNLQGKTLWVRALVGERLVPIVNASISVAEPAEIAALKYTNDKENGTWLKLFLPSSETVGSFAMMPQSSVMIFAGSSENGTDSVPITAPLSIKRIGAGQNERVEQ